MTTTRVATAQHFSSLDAVRSTQKQRGGKALSSFLGKSSMHNRSRFLKSSGGAAKATTRKRNATISASARKYNFSAGPAMLPLDVLKKRKKIWSTIKEPECPSWKCPIEGKISWP